MIRFSIATNALEQTTKISEMSNRDKVNLLSWLMNDLGITDKLREPSIAEKFDAIWEGLIEKLDLRR